MKQTSFPPLPLEHTYVLGEDKRLVIINASGQPCSLPLFLPHWAECRQLPGQVDVPCWLKYTLERPVPSLMPKPQLPYINDECHLSLCWLLFPLLVLHNSGNEESVNYWAPLDLNTLAWLANQFSLLETWDCKVEVCHCLQHYKIWEDVHMWEGFI